MRTDGNFAYYEAQTNSFSPFAVSGVKVAPTGTPVTTSISPGTSPATPLSVTPYLNWILYVVVAIIIFAAVYYYEAKKKAKKKGTGVPLIFLIVAFILIFLKSDSFI